MYVYMNEWFTLKISYSSNQTYFSIVTFYYLVILIGNLLDATFSNFFLFLLLFYYFSSTVIGINFLSTFFVLFSQISWLWVPTFFFIHFFIIFSFQCRFSLVFTCFVQHMGSLRTRHFFSFIFRGCVFNQYFSFSYTILFLFRCLFFMTCLGLWCNPRIQKLNANFVHSSTSRCNTQRKSSNQLVLH